MRAGYDVAIIGCGPTGALLANLLGSRGMSVVILEKQPEAYQLPRAVHFDGEAMRVFQSAGLAEEMEKITIVGRGMLFQAPDGKILVDWSRDQKVGPMGWYESYRFHQPDLEAVLRNGLQRFPSVECHFATEVSSISDTGDTAALTLADGRSVKARYVIGCDGAQSFLRKQLAIGLDDLGFNERWLVCDLILYAPMPQFGDYTIQYCDTENPGTYVRGTGMRRRFEMRLGAGDPDNFTDEIAWKRLQRWVGPDDAKLERAAIYTFRSGVAERWRSGRFFLAGDAAHQMPPFMGQGLGAGIRDAANLAWKLAAVCAGASDDLLETYQSERDPNVREFIALTVALGRLINQTAAGEAPKGRLKSIWPSLGPGLGARDGCVGTLAPQPLLAGDERSDDKADNGFYVLSCAGLENGSIAQVSGGEDWLAERGLFGIIVRPDGYVLCGGTTADELTEQICNFQDLITSAPPRRH